MLTDPQGSRARLLREAGSVVSRLRSSVEQLQNTLPPRVSDVFPTPNSGGGCQTWVGAGWGKDVVQDGVCGISGRAISAEHNETLSGEQASLGPLLLAGWQGLRNPLHGMKGLHTAVVLSLPTRPLESLHFQRKGSFH